MSSYNADYYYYEDRPIGFISRPYSSHRKEPPKQVKLNIKEEKIKIVVTNKVMSEKVTDAKKTLTTIKSEDGTFSVSELAEILNMQYIYLSKMIAGVKTLTINDVDYEIIVTTYSVDLYKNGMLYASNIMAKDAAKIMKRGFNYVRNLRASGKTDKAGWSLKEYEG